jgi:hypothetical protein
VFRPCPKYSESLSSPTIWEYTRVQFPCPGWTLIDSDTSFDGGADPDGVFFAVQGPNGYIVQFAWPNCLCRRRSAIGSHHRRALRSGLPSAVVVDAVKGRDAFR